MKFPAIRYVCIKVRINCIQNGVKSFIFLHYIAPGAFPYLYVPSPAEDPSDHLLHQLGRSINHALQVSLGAGSKEGDHVFKIAVIRGM